MSESSLQGGEPSQRSRCEECDGRTPHDVSIVVVNTSTERVKESNRKYARRPARLAECRRCGSTKREGLTDRTEAR